MSGLEWSLIAALLFSLALVGWAAATIGNPRRPLPRRPLPYPKRPRGSRHSQEDRTAATQRLRGGRRADFWPAPDRLGRRDLSEWPSDLYDE